MEFKSILIKDTTMEERKQIVKESLGNISAGCDGCMARLSEMYGEYIEGKKEIRDFDDIIEQGEAKLVLVDDRDARPKVKSVRDMLNED